MDFNNILEDLKKQGNLRRLPGNLPQNFIDFSSNDYLGLASRSDLANEFIENLKEYRFSSSASRLLSSWQESFNEFESVLEKKYRRPVLTFNSGYHANTGIIPALTSVSKWLIVADKLVHASIIDGVVLSRCEFRRFSHNNLAELLKIIDKNHSKFDNILVITESIFSMDGDSAPLEELLLIKKQFEKVHLYLDEAHSFGVRGKEGLGMSQDSAFPLDWDIIVVPLGKAATSSGAFVVCSEDTKEFLINKARSLIFSTALPPFQIKWNLFILDKLVKMDAERAHLQKLSCCLSEIIKNNFENQNTIKSHIQPLIIGDSHKVKKISEILYQNKIKALPIRKPTVPSGTERLRFSLSAGMTINEISLLDQVFKKIRCNIDF